MAVKVAMQRFDCWRWITVATSDQSGDVFQRVDRPLCRENMAELERLRGFNRLG